MKRAAFAVLSFALASILNSCESTNSLRAGGGAFDESELGRKLDANAHLDDPETPADKSFEQWRNKERY